jgi:DNA replication and repair protein RecF
MTGADPAAFTKVGATGEIFEVDSGRIARRA